MDAPKPGGRVGDRRGGSDRRDSERRNLETRRSPDNRRQQPRHQVPFGAWAVTGIMRCQDGRAWPVTLWDVSRRGACVVVIGEPGLQSGEAAQLTLHDSMLADTLVLEVQLCWQFCQGRETFLGMELSGNAELPEDCFLAPYLEQTWAEGEPTDVGLL